MFPLASGYSPAIIENFMAQYLFFSVNPAPWKTYS